MRYERANILPLALVITATILIGGIALGAVIIENLARAQETDQSIVAYYAADAGIENQLYEVRKKNTDVSTLLTSTETFTNGSAWTAVSGETFFETNQKIFPEIREGDFQFIDLFDPDNLASSGGVRAVQWSWNDSGSPTCEVELGIAPWDVTGAVVQPQNFQIVRGNGGLATYNGLDASKPYRLRFRPRFCDITDLTVTFYADGGLTTQIPFEGDIHIASEGTFENVRQAIAVSMPRLDILSGVFTYVIFSECTLLKDPSGASTCP